MYDVRVLCFVRGTLPAYMSSIDDLLPASTLPCVSPGAAEACPLRFGPTPSTLSNLRSLRLLSLSHNDFHGVANGYHMYYLSLFSPPAFSVFAPLLIFLMSPPLPCLRRVYRCHHGCILHLCGRCPPACLLVRISLI